jgi:hypothetical protein
MWRETIASMKENMKAVFNNFENSAISTVIEKEVGGNIIKTRRQSSVNDTNEWHAWLLQELHKARENRDYVIIITHHAPSRGDTCSAEDKEAVLEDAYVNAHHADCGFRPTMRITLFDD